MSAGNPLDARHPLRGLHTGDRIAWTVVTGYVAEDGGYESLVRDALASAGGAADVLVLAFPRERRRDVMRSLEAATIR